MYPRPSISEVKASELTTVSRNPLIGCIQFLLKGLPTRDDPVLNSCLFCLIWFAAILDKGVNSLRD